MGLLRGFIDFIQSIQNVSYPALVLTSQGNIRAEWTEASNKHFALEFLGDNNVRFVVFAPDPKERHKTNRASGLATIGSLPELVSPYGVFHWILNQTQKAA